jgi:hypothetical protein
MKKILITLAGLFLLYIVFYVLLEINYPVVSKWLDGSARILGKPINAAVYTNGHINNDIKVYRDKTNWDGKIANNYVLNLKYFDKYQMLKFIFIDLDEKWLGTPVSTNEADYKVINGYLFQSDVAYHCADFRDDMKGLNFDPHLKFTDKEIKFNIPPNLLKFDSVRIELNRK